LGITDGSIFCEKPLRLAVISAFQFCLLLALALSMDSARFGFPLLTSYELGSILDLHIAFTLRGQSGGVFVSFMQWLEYLA